MTSDSIKKCQKPLPPKYIDGWTLFLVCQLPENHAGDCRDERNPVEVLCALTNAAVAHGNAPK